jgi:hypothetical protein
VEVSLVPTLILAGLDDADPTSIEYSRWSRRVADRFGLIFGSEMHGHQLLHPAADAELEKNDGELMSLFTSLGLARRYSDGVTEVLNPLSLWAPQ